MFWLEIAKLAAPIAEKLLDKFFDLFKGASETYNASAKTGDDLDKFVKDAKSDMGQFQQLAREIDPNFKISGDADSASDFRQIVKVLEQLKAQTNDKSQIESIDSMIKAFGDAANQMDAPGYKGDKGDADLKIELPGLIPPSGNAYVGGYPAAPSISPTTTPSS
jgi:hypothetical protein